MIFLIINLIKNEILFDWHIHGLARLFQSERTTKAANTQNLQQQLSITSNNTQFGFSFFERAKE